MATDSAFDVAAEFASIAYVDRQPLVPPLPPGWDFPPPVALPTEPGLSFTYENGFYTAQNVGGLAIDNAVVATGLLPAIGSTPTESSPALNTLTIAFRGTDQIPEDLLDPIHNHFARFDPLVSGIVNLAEQSQVSGHEPIQQIMVTGHSLGGAMVQDLMLDPRIEALHVPIFGFTFGSPGADKIGELPPDEHILNFANTDDIVPQLDHILPPTLSQAIGLDGKVGETVFFERPEETPETISTFAQNVGNTLAALNPIGLDAIENVLGHGPLTQLGLNAIAAQMGSQGATNPLAGLSFAGILNHLPLDEHAVVLYVDDAEKLTKVARIEDLLNLDHNVAYALGTEGQDVLGVAHQAATPGALQVEFTFKGSPHGMAGFEGDDVLIAGGAGDRNGWMLGGAGGDTFEFLPGSGVETIFDFQPGVDHIAIASNANGSGIMTAQTAAAHVLPVPGGSQVALGNDNFILLPGVDFDQLHNATNFHIV